MQASEGETRMKHWVKTTLRRAPALRALALRGSALFKSLACAEPGLYTLCYHHRDKLMASAQIIPIDRG
jgi:hypothetical protein